MAATDDFYDGTVKNNELEVCYEFTAIDLGVSVYLDD